MSHSRLACAHMADSGPVSHPKQCTPAWPFLSRWLVPSRQQRGPRRLANHLTRTLLSHLTASSAGAGVLSTHNSMVTQGTAGLHSGANASSRTVPASSCGPGRPPPFRWAGSRLQWPHANACRQEPAPLAALGSSAEEAEPQTRPSDGTSGVFSRRQPEEPAAEAPLVRVRLVVNYRVHSRQMLCIGGSQIPFGWSFLSIAKVPMVWTEGDLWVTEVYFWHV